MRFLTYLSGAVERAGVLGGETVYPLPAGVGLIDLLGDDGTKLREAGKRALATEAGVPLKSVRLAAPIPRPPTIRDFMTFESHVSGARGPANPVAPQWYAAPAFYFTNPYAVIGPADPVPMAPGTARFDLELEVAAIVGTAGRDLSPEEAERHIAGYTILVDWSARDVQRAEMSVGLGPAKGKDTATTIGPFLVTPDELEPFRTGHSFGLDMMAGINDAVLGRDRLDSMAWSFGDLIAYASRGTWVRPGDVIGSGTCGGGCLAEMWGRHGAEAYPALQPGDTVTVSVREIGEMTLEIVAGASIRAIPEARR